MSYITVEGLVGSTFVHVEFLADKTDFQLTVLRLLDGPDPGTVVVHPDPGWERMVRVFVSTGGAIDGVHAGIEREVNNPDMHPSLLAHLLYAVRRASEAK
jgi:hypothetical protein